MKDTPLAPEQQAELEKAYQDLEVLSRKHGVSARGATLTRFEYDDEEIIAIADGLGGAVVKWLEAVGDDEVLVHRFHEFDNEYDAYRAVEWLRQRLEDVAISRTEFFDQLAAGKHSYKAYRPG